jgi:predicted deacetylase
MSTRICIEFDDLHPNPDVDCLDVMEELYEQYEEILINFFVPAQYGGMPLFDDKKWCKRLQVMVENERVCLGVHGLLHSPEEMKHKTYQEAVSSIRAAEAIFNAAGLPYAKAFRGPHWGVNGPTIDALIDLGYTHLYSHINYFSLTEPYRDKIKTVIYNFNFADKWPHMENLYENSMMVAHGHTSKHRHLNCGNGIASHLDKVDYLVRNFECMRIDEV